MLRGPVDDLEAAVRHSRRPFEPLPNRRIVVREAIEAERRTSERRHEWLSDEKLLAEHVHARSQFQFGELNRRKNRKQPPVRIMPLTTDPSCGMSGQSRKPVRNEHADDVRAIALD